MVLDAKTMQNLKEGLDSFLERMFECEKHGHREPKDLPYTWDSVNGLQARGFCTYCNSFYDRKLTQKEKKEFEEFRKSLYVPMMKYTG